MMTTAAHVSTSPATASTVMSILRQTGGCIRSPAGTKKLPPLCGHNPIPPSTTDNTPACEADALVTKPSQTSGYSPNGRTSLEVRMGALHPLDTIPPPGNADVVLRFYNSAS